MWKTSNSLLTSIGRGEHTATLPCTSISSWCSAISQTNNRTGRRFNVRMLNILECDHGLSVRSCIGRVTSHMSDRELGVRSHTRDHGLGVRSCIGWVTSHMSDRGLSVRSHIRDHGFGVRSCIGWVTSHMSDCRLGVRSCIGWITSNMSDCGLSVRSSVGFVIRNGNIDTVSACSRSLTY